MERHLLLRNGDVVAPLVGISPTRHATAPGLLWLFGERGTGELLLLVRAKPKSADRDIIWRVEEVGSYDRVRRAFPEANIVGVRLSPQDR